MSTTSSSLEATLWSDPEHAALACDVVKRMGTRIRPIGAGGARSTEVRDLAESLECAAEDDFRKMLVDRPAAFVLLTTMEGVTRADLEAALAQGSIVLTTEPIATGFDELVTLRPRAGRSSSTPPTSNAGQIIHMPAFRQMPGWTAAAEPVEVISTVRLLSFASLGRPGDCSLFARLYDAWEVILGFTPLPESIDASLIGPTGDIPEDPRQITGHLAAHARMPGRCGAVLEVSDITGPGFRRAHVVGESGQFHVGDQDFRLMLSGGDMVDSKAAPPQPATFAELIAHQWSHLIERPKSSLTSTAGDQSALACALACLLSARTAEPESPAKLLAMQALS